MTQHVLSDGHLSLPDWWSFGLGLGFLPAPGTMGSLLGLPCVLGLSVLPVGLQLLLIAMLVGLTWRACLATYVRLGELDHSAIVSDEIAGVLLTFACVPLSVATLVFGFVMFRVLDIFKPWPVGWVDQRHDWHGHQVMLDDVLAGVMSNVLLQCLCAYGWLI